MDARCTSATAPRESVRANELVESQYAAMPSQTLCTSIRFLWLLLLWVALLGHPAPVPERGHPLFALENSRHVLG